MTKGLVLQAAMLGPMRHSFGRTLLAVLAIALGVALGLAIYLINRTAADEMSAAARSLYGLANLSVQGGAQGFDESLYPVIARTPGVAVASPTIELDAKLADARGALRILGVDGFQYEKLQPSFLESSARSHEPPVLLGGNAMLLSASAARELSVSAGDTIHVQVGLERRAFSVLAILPPAAMRERVAVVDIATAQSQFGWLGRLSSVDIRLTAGTSTAMVRQALAQRLPSTLRIIEPGEAGDEALRLSRAYRANLTALALVALFTGGFFVYSTQALATLRRRREFAVLHAIGLTRTQQLWLLLSSGLVIGALGAALGIGLGWLLARFGMRSLASDLGAGYFELDDLAQGFVLRPAELLAFWLLGVSVALAGVLRPAVEAARIPTAAALKATDVTSGVLRTHGGIVLVLWVLGIALLALPPVRGLPLPGYASIALLLIAAVVAMPTLIRTVLHRLPHIRNVVYEIAIAQLAGTARYAALSVSAILVSFSLMVSMAIMVDSFRTSLDAWMQRILPADIYLRVGYGGQSAHIDEATAAALRGMDGLRSSEVSRFALAQVAPEMPDVTVIARSFDHVEPEQSLWLTVQTADRGPATAMPAWISEAASDLFGLQPGEQHTIHLGERAIQIWVRGVWRDYEHQNGALVIPREQYVRATGDTAVNTVWMWVDPEANASTIRQRITTLLPRGADFDVREPHELRAMSLHAFDRTFAVTYVLEVVAVVIGLFGIAAGISAQVLSRRHELGALRHLGFTRRQIGSMLALEGALLGAVGVLVGLLAGGVISLILVYVVNRQSFHWSMDVFVPGNLLLLLSTVLIASAALIAVLSGRQALGADVVRAVKEDW